MEPQSDTVNLYTHHNPALYSRPLVVGLAQIRLISFRRLYFIKTLSL